MNQIWFNSVVRGLTEQLQYVDCIVTPQQISGGGGELPSEKIKENSTSTPERGDQSGRGWRYISSLKDTTKKRNRLNYQWLFSNGARASRPDSRDQQKSSLKVDIAERTLKDTLTDRNSGVSSRIN